MENYKRIYIGNNRGLYDRLLLTPWQLLLRIFGPCVALAICNLPLFNGLCKEVQCTLQRPLMVLLVDKLLRDAVIVETCTYVHVGDGSEDGYGESQRPTKQVTVGHWLWYEKSQHFDINCSYCFRHFCTVLNFTSMLNNRHTKHPLFVVEVTQHVLRFSEKTK